MAGHAGKVRMGFIELEPAIGRVLEAQIVLERALHTMAVGTAFAITELTCVWVCMTAHAFTPCCW